MVYSRRYDPKLTFGINAVINLATMEDCRDASFVKSVSHSCGLSKTAWQCAKTREAEAGLAKQTSKDAIADNLSNCSRP